MLLCLRFLGRSLSILLVIDQKTFSNKMEQPIHTTGEPLELSEGRLEISFSLAKGLWELCLLYSSYSSYGIRNIDHLLINTDYQNAIENISVYLNEEKISSLDGVKGLLHYDRETNTEECRLDLPRVDRENSHFQDMRILVTVSDKAHLSMICGPKMENPEITDAPPSEPPLPIQDKIEVWESHATPFTFSYHNLKKPIKVYATKKVTITSEDGDQVETSHTHAYFSWIESYTGKGPWKVTSKVDGVKVHILCSLIVTYKEGFLVTPKIEEN